MSAKYPRCQECGKVQIPAAEFKRVKEIDKDKVCRCQMVNLAEFRPSQAVAEKPSAPKFKLSKCRKCGFYIIPWNYPEEISDPEILNHVCKCKAEPEKLEVIEQPQVTREVVYLVPERKRRQKEVPKKSIAIILAILLGPIGIHRFYVGTNEFGIIYFIISLFVIPMIAVCTWGIGLFLYLFVYMAIIIELLMWGFMGKNAWEDAFGQ